MSLTTSRTALFVPLFALLGCVGAAESPPPLGTSEAAITSSNRLSMNRLSMNRLSMNSLSMDRLSPDGIHLNATDLVLDEPGRELLRYTVRCALPEGQSLVATVGETRYTFLGLIGLEPDWMQKPIKEKAQRWISACLLAHVNGYGVEVPVSLRGSHKTLTTTRSERETYVKEEISFFGNVFQTDSKNEDELRDEVGPLMYSCGGASLQQACDVGVFGPARSCAANTDCAIDFTGACRDTTGAHADVCSFAYIPGVYGGCHTASKSSTGQWPTSAVYNEVITVYLQPTDFEAFYPTCESR